MLHHQQLYQKHTIINMLIKIIKKSKNIIDQMFNQFQFSSQISQYFKMEQTHRQLENNGQNNNIKKIRSRSTTRYSIFSPRQLQNNNQIFLSLPNNSSNQNQQILTYLHHHNQQISTSRTHRIFTNNIQQHNIVEQINHSARSSRIQYQNRNCLCRITKVYTILLYLLLALVFVGIIFAIFVFGKVMLQVDPIQKYQHQHHLHMHMHRQMYR